MHIKQTHISAARPNLLKEHVSPAHELTDKIKHENTTMCINHWADNAGFKGVTLNQLCSGLTGKCFEMPNASYTRPLWASLKTKTVCESQRADHPM